MTSFLNNNSQTPVADGYNKIHSVCNYKITISHTDGVWKGCDLFGPFSTNGREKRVAGRLAVIKIDDRYLLLSNSEDETELGITFLDVKSFKEAKKIIDHGGWSLNDDFQYISYGESYDSVKAFIAKFIAK